MLSQKSISPCRALKPRGLHTDEDTISLLRRLAVHYPDDVIAGILNRQGRRTASGERFTANQVTGSLRRYRNIPRYEPAAEPPPGDLVTLKDAAQSLGVAASTLHRWINDGFMAGEQITPGAPKRIRVTDELRGRFVEENTAGLSANAGSHDETWHLAPDGVAACKARRTRSRSCSVRAT